MEKIKSASQFEYIVKNKPVLVDFYANWCGPCKKLGPELESMIKEYPNVKFCKVDIDENEDIASEWNVRKLPTTIIFTEDEEIVIEGVYPEKIRSKLQKL